MSIGEFVLLAMKTGSAGSSVTDMNISLATAFFKSLKRVSKKRIILPATRGFITEPTNAFGAVGVSGFAKKFRWIAL
jgi:hypothetical protein